MKEYRVSIAQGSRCGVELRAFRCGGDCSVTICGGTRHHVGAVSLGCPKPAGDPLPGNRATVSTVCGLGHRDDEITRWAARYLAETLGCTVSVAAGLHVDQASSEEIHTLTENCEQACRMLAREAAGESEKS